MESTQENSLDTNEVINVYAPIQHIDGCKTIMVTRAPRKDSLEKVKFMQKTYSHE
jgi:hypothetical protein